MNQKAAVTAVLTFIITLATALIALFSQESVTSFSDISEVGYATAFLGALVSATKGYKDRMSESPHPVGGKWK